MISFPHEDRCPGCTGDDSCFCNPPEKRDLQKRIDELETAIRTHREYTGHQMCHENDEELWNVLGDNIQIDHSPPSWCEFMTKCAEYRASKDKK